MSAREEDLRSAPKSAPTLALCWLTVATAVTPNGPGPSSADAREAEVRAGTSSTMAAYTGVAVRRLMREVRFIGDHCGR